jgi:hypothetical protein
MLSLKIDQLRTVNEKGENAVLFDPFSNALALTMDISASSELLALPNPTFDAIFQVINPITDTVIISEKVTFNFSWGKYFWISLGNNWGPNYDTPEKWGLHPADWGMNDIFGFRGIIEAYSQNPPNGIKALEAFDVSKIRWFRIEKIFIL